MADAAAPPPVPRSRWTAAAALMAASGFSGLALQLAWTQQAAVWLGHESAAVLGVVAAFFGGLSLGALLLGPAIARSGRPLAWYVGCELVIAAWGAALLVAIEPVAGGLVDLTGLRPGPLRQWGVAFGGTLLLLLPATAAMGATLPAMERLLARQAGPGRTVAGLYAANTAGAVAGVLAAAFVLVPAWGLSATVGLVLLLNLGCALGAAWVWRFQHDPGAVEAPVADRPGAALGPAGVPAGALWLRLAATGCLGIGYELLVVRALRQVAENTVFTFALLLAVYLVGTALGAAWQQRRVRSRVDGEVAAGDRLLLVLAVTTGLGSACLWGLLPMHAALRELFGPGFAAALAAEAALAVIVFLPATLAMGALFSLWSGEALRSGLGLGRALGINTLGAAAAAPFFGVALVPALGLKPALLAVASAYLLLRSRVAWRRPGGWVVAGGIGAFAAFAPPLVTVTLADGAQVLSHQEGALGAVSVVRAAGGELTLHIDNRQQEGSSVTGYADGRQALLPLLLHPQPGRALFLGLGTGVTAGTAALLPGLTVEAVELLPEVVSAAEMFRPNEASAGAKAASPQVHVADARRFVRASRDRYDVIVSDNFHPARSGSASLYTVEHFQAVRQRLAPGGLFCQWLPLHQMDLASLRSIVRSFVTVHPQAWAVLATNSLDTPVVGLIARSDGDVVPVSTVRKRLAAAGLEPTPADFGLFDEWALLGSVVAGPQSLQRWSAPAPPNTDDHPVVASLAPRLAYAPDSSPRQRLLAWLQELPAPQAADPPLAAIDLTSEPGADRRLAAYRAARNQYLLAGRDVKPSADAQQMLRQVQAPLLAVLRTSPDFRPAYEPLLPLAAALARHDRAAAVALLRELDALQPAWPEARAGLARLAQPGSP